MVAEVVSEEETEVEEVVDSAEEEVDSAEEEVVEEVEDLYNYLKMTELLKKELLFLSKDKKCNYEIF